MRKLILGSDGRKCLRAILPAVILLALGAGSAQAQNVLMNSAETINKGNFKIAGFPTVLFAEGDGDNQFGLASRFGYGFTDKFDVEAKLAFFDGLKFYGFDAELWLAKGSVDVSVALGAHKTDLDNGTDSKAIDTALLVSDHLTPRLELYGGLNMSFESLDNAADTSFTRVYLVPGVEYKVTDDLDFLAEFGLGLNDDSPNYVSVGLAFYIR
jgi:hypothetical protein